MQGIQLEALYDLPELEVYAYRRSIPATLTRGSPASHESGGQDGQLWFGTVIASAYFYSTRVPPAILTPTKTY